VSYLRFPRLLPELADSELTQGVVFGWLPEFRQRDFVRGAAATVGANVIDTLIEDGLESRVASRSLTFNSTSANDRITFPCPVSSGDVSWLCLGRLDTNSGGGATNGTMLGLTNQSSAEHVAFSNGLIYVGPFATSRWISAATRPLDLTRLHCYAGTMASGVSNGASVYLDDHRIGQSTITNSFPTSIGVHGQSSTPTSGDQYSVKSDVAAVLIWDRALAVSELMAAIRDPAALFKTHVNRSTFALGAPATAPEITVTGNTFDITDGDATPSLTDHTDFGTTPQGTTKPRTFTITNFGDADLVISSVALSGAGAGEFTITANPTGTITPAGTGTLVVRADAANVGTFAATVTVNSNDANEAAFDFAIAVEVTEPASDDSGGIPFSPTTNVTFSPSGLLIR